MDGDQMNKKRLTNQIISKHLRLDRLAPCLRSDSEANCCSATSIIIKCMQTFTQKILTFITLSTLEETSSCEEAREVKGHGGGSGICTCRRAGRQRRNSRGADEELCVERVRS